MKQEKGKIMSEVPDFMKEESNEVSSFKNTSLQTLGELADRIVGEQKKVLFAEAELKKSKAELRKLTDEELPAAMAEVNMRKFETDSGHSVTIKKIYNTSIKVEDRPKAFEWLRENGYADLIKNTVSADFGKGEDEVALKFQALAEKERIDVKTDTKIHPMTLRAWGKEQVENGRSVPEVIGITVIDHAEIKGVK